MSSDPSTTITTPAPGPVDALPHWAFWPRRVPRAITPPATSLWHNLAISALRYPDKPALVFFGTVTTYAGLHEQVERLAGFLQSLGVARGDRVLLQMQNCPQLVVAHWAILRADAVVVPVNPMNRSEELRHLIADSDARLAICGTELAQEMAAASNALGSGQRLAHLLATHFFDAFDVHVQGDDAPPPAWLEWLARSHEAPALDGGAVHAWSVAMASTRAPTPASAQAQDLALLIYTSGTTGAPKGCMHAHASFMHQAAAGALVQGGTAENKSLAVAPLFHATGLVVLHNAAYNGSALLLMPRWDRELAGRLITKWRVTHWGNIPTMVIDLLASPNLDRYDLSSLVYIGGGGAAMPQAVAQRLFEQFGLRYAEGYGLTETAAPCLFNPLDATKQQCLGIPYLSTEALVVDPDTLRPLPPGEAGEILIAGPQVFQGYWKRPDDTAAAFVQIAGKRFFRTGDLGRIDEDGYYFMTDRLKRMINASGYKVWPAEVESMMFAHPAIQEVCIIAIADAYRGESVKAVVVLRPSMRGQVSEQDIIDWCRAHMAVYKTPRVVQFVDALPKSGSGKVMWRQLQEQQDAAAAR